MILDCLKYFFTLDGFRPYEGELPGIAFVLEPLVVVSLHQSFPYAKIIANLNIIFYLYLPG